MGVTPIICNKRTFSIDDEVDPTASLLARIILCWEEVKLPVLLPPRDIFEKVVWCPIWLTLGSKRRFLAYFGYWNFMAIFFWVCRGRYDVEHGMRVGESYMMISWLCVIMCVWALKWYTKCLYWDGWFELKLSEGGEAGQIEEKWVNATWCWRNVEQQSRLKWMWIEDGVE